MIKIMMTTLLAFLLTACFSQEKQDTNTTKTTEKKVIQEEIIEKKVIPAKIETPKITEVKALPEVITTETNATTEEKKSKKVQTAKDSSTETFTLKTLNGETIHVKETSSGLIFEEYKDKAVFLLFFGHRCPPCMAEIPVLKALTEKNHKDLEILAIEVQGQTEEQLKAFKERKGINYHLVASGPHFRFIDYIGQKANWGGSIPFLIGFNKSGAVKVVHVGGIGAKEFDNIYTSLTK